VGLKAGLGNVEKTTFLTLPRLECRLLSRETSRLARFIDSRLTDDRNVVSLTCRPPFTAQEDCWYSFLLEVESTLGP
jgi:hypothetical protein